MENYTHPHQLFAFLSCLKVTHEAIAERLGVSVQLVDGWNGDRKKIPLARSAELFALALEAVHQVTRFPDRAKAEACLAYLRALQEMDALRLQALQAIPTHVETLAEWLRIHPIETWGEQHLLAASISVQRLTKALRETKTLKLLPHPQRTEALAQFVTIMEEKLRADANREAREATAMLAACPQTRAVCG